MSSKGSATGDATMRGLPFTPAASTDMAGSIGYATAITFANQMVLSIQIYIDFYEITEAGATTPLTNADFANNSRIGFTATYFV